MAEKNKAICVILHNIRSLYNVGAIFRTADAAGVKKIYLTGYTPTPLDGFGKIRKDFHKTALGAEKTVDWKHYKKISSALKKLRQDKISIIAVEQSPAAINYKKFKPVFPLAFIFGNEVRGLSKKILRKCDKIIEIPMRGRKESLNVSVAGGIILFSV